MLPTSVDAVKAILKADPTITPNDRAMIITAIRNHGRQNTTSNPAVPQENRILRRAEVAKRLARSTRSVDNLARQGVLRKVILPGRQRAYGFRLADVERLITEDYPSVERHT